MTVMRVNGDLIVVPLSHAAIGRNVRKVNVFEEPQGLPGHLVHLLRRRKQSSKFERRGSNIVDQFRIHRTVPGHRAP